MAFPSPRRARPDRTAFVLLVLAAPIFAGQGGPATGPGPDRGEALYRRHCSGCHGEEGRGDGVAAPYLEPKPRDFSLGRFKITSTPPGSLPTDDDLLHVLRNGMPGSAMPSWGHFPESDLLSLVAFTKTLARFYDEDEGEWVSYYDLGRDMTPMAIPAMPSRAAETIARGKEAYAKAECGKCHGDDGKGVGESTPTLVDEWGFPSTARDFTAGVFKGGIDPVEVYRRISIGMGGTAMPAQSDTLTDDERWASTLYVLSLVREGAQERSRQIHRTLLARRVPRGAEYRDPGASAWEAESFAYLALAPLWWRDDRIEGLRVRSVHDGVRAYLHLRWEDASPDAQAVRSQDFRDAAAVQFARTADPPFLAMGAAADEVNLWLWKADRDGGEGAYPDVHTVYPNAFVMDYPEAEGWKPGERDAAGRPLRDLGRRFAAGWAAGNPVADPEAASPVENLSAHGVSTLEALPSVSTKVEGRGLRDRDGWSVVLSRALAAEDPGDAPLTPGARVPVAFAIWDGSAGDRNGQKSITIWHTLEIAP